MHWPERFSESADAVFEAAGRGDVHAIAPQLWSAECANGCWKRVPRGLATREEALENYRRISALPITLIDTTHLAEHACIMALELGITVYDALYVATALFAKATLVTLDASLVQKVRDGSLDVSVTYVPDFTL